MEAHSSPLPAGTQAAAARCIEQARKLLQAGVRTLIFSTVTADRTQLVRLSQQVLPELERWSLDP